MNELSKEAFISNYTPRQKCYEKKNARYGIEIKLCQISRGKCVKLTQKEKNTLNSWVTKQNQAVSCVLEIYPNTVKIFEGRRVSGGVAGNAEEKESRSQSNEGRARENGIEKDKGRRFPVTRARSVAKTPRGPFVTVVNTHPPNAVAPLFLEAKTSPTKKDTQTAH